MSRIIFAILEEVPLHKLLSTTLFYTYESLTWYFARMCDFFWTMRVLVVIIFPTDVYHHFVILSFWKLHMKQFNKRYELFYGARGVYNITKLCKNDFAGQLDKIFGTHVTV